MRDIIVAVLLAAGLAQAAGSARAAGVPLIDVQPVAMCDAGVCPDTSLDLAYLDEVSRGLGLALRLRPAIAQDFSALPGVAPDAALVALGDFAAPLAAASGVRNRVYAGIVEGLAPTLGLGWLRGIEPDPRLVQRPFLVVDPGLGPTATSTALLAQIGVLQGAEYVQEGGFLDSAVFSRDELRRGEIRRFSSFGEARIADAGLLTGLPTAGSPGATVVPLPHAGLVLGGALAGLAIMRRRAAAPA